MPIPNENFSAVMLLCELDLQCKIIDYTFNRLTESAEHWIAIEQGIDDGKTVPPIEIIGLCSICLSAAASIYRILHIGKRNGKDKARITQRCKALMTLLKNPELSKIAAIVVRNSWEHLDERLDYLLNQHSYRSYAEMHVSVKPPSNGTFILRHFDPIQMTIKHGPNEAISLKELITETKDLSSRISNALKDLQKVQCVPY